MFRSIDNTLSTFEIHVSVTSCRNVYFSLKLESFETVANQRAGISSRRQWCSCESANRLWKELDGMFRLTELFASNLNASMLVISPLNTRSTIIEEQLYKYELTELAFLPSTWKIEPELSLETGHSLDTFGCYQQNVTAVGWSPMSNTLCTILRWNSAFEKFATTFNEI